MKRELLMLPGPTPVPQEVLAALTGPMVNHRGGAFEKMVAEMIEDLKTVFQTKGAIVILPAAGTGGLEAAAANFFAPGDKVLALSIGSFGERFAKVAGIYGANVERLTAEAGQAITPERLAQRLKEDTAHEIKAILLTHNETSTGVTNPLEQLAKARGNHPALLLVDAVSSLAAIDVQTDAWQLDVVITASQKALMVPPGLAILALSEQAQARLKTQAGVRFYFDLNTYLKNPGKMEIPYTPAVSLYYGLAVSLKMILADGLPTIFARHRLLGAMARAGAQALGLELLADPQYASPAVTAVLAGELGPKELRQRAAKLAGVTLAGGQGNLVDKIFRMGHIGYVFPQDILTALAALELALPDAEPGAALSAAQKVWQQSIMQEVAR